MAALDDPITLVGESDVKPSKIVPVDCNDSRVSEDRKLLTVHRV